MHTISNEIKSLQHCFNYIYFPIIYYNIEIVIKNEEIKITLQSLVFESDHILLNENLRTIIIISMF